MLAVIVFFAVASSKFIVAIESAFGYCGHSFRPAARHRCTALAIYLDKKQRCERSTHRQSELFTPNLNVTKKSEYMSAALVLGSLNAHKPALVGHSFYRHREWVLGSLKWSGSTLIAVPIRAVILVAAHSDSSGAMTWLLQRDSSLRAVDLCDFGKLDRESRQREDSDTVGAIPVPPRSRLLGLLQQTN